MSLKQFSLKWSNFSEHILTAFEDLRGNDDFTDVTLSCEGKRVKCHKLLLSACSVYFTETFKENPCKHPVIILNGIEYVDLQAIITFVYNGQVNISQDRLSTFLQTAELLQIKGLTEKNDTEEAPTAKKRSHTVGKTEPAIPSSSHNLASDDGSLNTPEIVTARQPIPKRKRIGPARFMKKQNESHINNDSQVPVKIQAGSSVHSSSSVNFERRWSDDGLSVMDEALVFDNSAVSGYSGFLSPEVESIISSHDRLTSSPIQESSSHEIFYSNNNHQNSLTPEHVNIIEYEGYNYETLSDEDNDNQSINDMLGEFENNNSSTSYLTSPGEPEIDSANVMNHYNSFSPVVDDEKPVHFVTTKRGYKIKYDNFTYTKDKSILEKAYWRCINNKKYKCKGRLLVINDQVTGTKPHNDLCSKDTTAIPS